MNIRITVQSSSGNIWDEDYCKPDIHTMSAALQWAKDLINWFNETANGGNTRTLVAVKKLNEGEGDPRTTTR